MWLLIYLVYLGVWVKLVIRYRVRVGFRFVKVISLNKKNGWKKNNVFEGYWIYDLMYWLSVIKLLVYR